MPNPDQRLPFSLPWDPFAPIDVTYQYAYPISDITATNWDTAPTASQSLYAQLDETVRSDTDYIFYDG